MALEPSLGLPVVYLVDDEGVVRDALAWPTAPACLVLFERLAERGLLSLLPMIYLTGHGDVPMAVAGRPNKLITDERRA